MKTRNLILTALILVLALWLLYPLTTRKTPQSNGVDNNLPSVSSFEQTISDGTITIIYPSDSFGLATNKSQILGGSYIPPCDEIFSYCVYYIGKEFTGTNFESAGVRVGKRVDFVDEKTCLEAPPDGFTEGKTPDNNKTDTEYASSVFLNVGDAGAGHSAKGSVYRLYVKQPALCYEFETRIGQSQFQNYPSGSINEFTSINQKSLELTLLELIQTISLSSEKNHLFP